MTRSIAVATSRTTRRCSPWPPGCGDHLRPPVPLPVVPSPSRERDGDLQGHLHRVPRGIPEANLDNTADLRDPYPGDAGLRFLPSVSEAILMRVLPMLCLVGDQDAFTLVTADREKDIAAEVSAVLKLDTPEKLAVHREFTKCTLHDGYEAAYE